MIIAALAVVYRRYCPIYRQWIISLPLLVVCINREKRLPGRWVGKDAGEVEPAAGSAREPMWLLRRQVPPIVVGIGQGALQPVAALQLGGAGFVEYPIVGARRGAGILGGSQIG